ncbi:MAG: HAD family phosphatase [Eubacteriales bacterium]|nr:HAD family phosphatase [Eubacteriales bacterium]
MLEAVVFDMDGIIFDSERLMTRCWMELDKQYGIPNVEDVCVECLGTNDEETKRIFLHTYGQDFPYERYEQEMMHLYRKWISEGKLEMKPGVTDILSWLKQQGIKVGLATSSRRVLAVEEIREAGLLSFFDSITCGDEVSRSKPEPDIYQKACQNLGVKPENAFAIEDSYHGVRAGKSAGMSVIMVPDMKQPDEAISNLADIVLPSLIKAKDFLEAHWDFDRQN